MKGKIKRLFFYTSICLLLILVPCSFFEVVLRFTPYRIKPYWALFVHQRHEPVVNIVDPVLGWRPKPGHYRILTLGNRFDLTIWPWGDRATAEAPPLKSKSKNIIIIGCSVVQGWAISNQETFAWKLQSKHPDVSIINLGVVGYSTYQSMLYLEDFLRRHPVHPDIVIYGFIDDHAQRNVADIDWLLNISHQARRLNVQLPYCLAKGENIQCYPPESYPRWFLDKKSLLVNLLKDAYMKFKYSKRSLQEVKVTQELLLRLDEFCKLHHARLLVVNLLGTAFQSTYKDFLSSKNIEAVDCYDKRMDSAKFKVARDLHPNGEANTIYANCIDRYLR